MAEPSSGNEEEKEVTKVNSFTKILRSPAPEGSPKKKSSNPLTKFLRRKSSRKGNDDGGDASSPEVVDSEPIEEEEELEKDSSLVEEVKEVVETAFHDLVHRKKKETPDEHEMDESRDESFSETNSKHHHFLGKFKEGFEKGKEGLKEEYGKAKEEFKSILLKEKSVHEHHQQHVEIPNEHHEQKPKPDISEDTPLDEVKAPSLAQRIQEEVIAVVSTIEASKKGDSTSQQERKDNKEEKKEEIEVEKKEDNCVTSLAQGLQNLCSWGSKKED